MPGPTVKEILLKWNIDNTNWKAAITQLAALLEKSNKENAKNQAAAAVRLDAQKAKLKEIVAARKGETVEIEKQIEKLKVKTAAAAAEKGAAAAKLGAEKAAVAEVEKQVAQQKAIQAIQKTLQQEINTKLMNEKLVTAEINKQNAALRLQTAQQRATGGGAGGRGRKGGEGKGGGFLGGFLGGFGSRLAGTIGLAVLSAEGLEHTLEELIIKTKEFIESTGPLQQVREQFEKLAITSGKDPAKFIGALRDATHGLVDDMGLYRNANTFMQSGIKASQADIVELTAATVGLARAQGRDAAEAVQSLNRFFLTGYPRTLAYATGIQRNQLVVQGLGHATDGATKSTLAFKQAQEAIVSQFKAIGEPALTFTDRLKQLEVAQHRFWEEIVIGLTNSKGFQSFLGVLGSIADKFSEMSERAGSWGLKLGGVFEALGEGIKTVYQVFASLADIIGSVFDELRTELTEVFGSSDFSNRILTFSGIMRTLAGTFVILRGEVEKYGLAIKDVFQQNVLGLQLVLAKASGDTKKFEELAKKSMQLDAELTQRSGEINSDTLDSLAALEGQADKSRYSIKYSAPSNVYTAEQEEAAARKTAKAKEQIATESAKIELEQTQARIHKEEQLVQFQYESGLLTIKEYLDKKKELEDQDFSARKKQLKEEFDAKMHYMDLESRETRELAKEKSAQADLDAQLQLASIDRQKSEIALRLQEDVAKKVLTPDQATKYATQTAKQAEAQAALVRRSQSASKRQASAETAEVDANRLIAVKKYAADSGKIDEEQAQKGRQLTQQEITDKIAARKKLNDTIESLEKAQIERSRQNTEYEFQQGEIGAQEYLDKKVQYIEQDYEATKTAEEKKLNENKNSEVAKAEFAAKMAKAAEDREKGLTKLSLDEVEIRTKAIEQSYDRAQKLIESQLKYQQSLDKTKDFGGKGEERTLIEKEIDLLKSRLEQEVKSLSLTKSGTEAWFQQMEKIQATKAALVQYNEELIKSHDLSTGIAAALKEMAGAASKFPKIGAQRVSKGLETLGGGIEESQQFRQRMASRAKAAELRASGKTAAPTTPEEIFKSLQKAAQEAGVDIEKNLKSASASVEEWRQKLVASIAALDVLINKATGKDSQLTESGLSGQKVGELPTATSSDMMSLMPAVIASSSSSSNVGPAGQQAATGLTLVAQAAKQAQTTFTSFVSSSVGDNGLMGFFKNLGKNAGAASDDLGNFTDSLSSIAGNIGGISSAAKGTGGPFAAGMQGLTSGASLGMEVAGPWGAAIGGGAGLVMGIFSGKAKKEAERIAKEITAQFNAVLTEVQAGTLGLGSAVTQEITIIQSAVDQLSGKKGGRDELKAMLPQMEQQLAQLQAQQQSILKSFDKQLEIASSPTASQALVQPIQQIIDTYQQYVLAGGSVTLANQYLQDSFKNLVTQGLDQLNQAEQDAVTNALNYNDLLLQRQQLIQNTNQQIQDIMSQGVAVRQMPEGVTKARQLQQVMLNAQNQQAQLDQEIAVSQHKLQNESKIFQLATTRVGLETQLVALQNAQADKSDAATQALLQEVAAFSSATPGNLPTALGMIGLGGSYINPSQEPGLKPIPPVLTGIAAVDLQNQLQYQQALAYYNQQANLPTTSTLPALGQGGMGITPAGAFSSATSLSSSALGGTLDALASNIAAFPAAMQTMFTDASTVINVGGALLTGIAAALGAPTTTSTGIGTSVPQSTLSTGGPMRNGRPGMTSVGPVSAGSFVSDAIAANSEHANALVSASVQRTTLEQNISDLSATRVQSEMKLVALKMQEINSDMIRINAWNTLIGTTGGRVGASSAPTLEDLLQNTYQTRSRQGFGGFVGETASPL